MTHIKEAPQPSVDRLRFDQLRDEIGAEVIESLGIVGDWPPLERIDEPFLDLDPKLVYAATAILLELLMMKRGIELEKLCKYVEFMRLGTTLSFAEGAITVADDVTPPS